MRRRVPITALTVAAWIAGAPAAATSQRGAGTIRGSVTLTEMRGAPLATTAYGRRDVAPRPAARGPETRNVVVFLTGTPAQGAVPSMRASIAQRNEQFDPQVAAVTTGSTIDFPNADPYFHNVFSLSSAATFNLGRFRSGESRSRQFTNPGIVKVVCQIHAQMNASIVVLDHPWFVIPDEDGTFTIPNVPAGERTVVAWHERIGEKRERLRVTTGAVTNVTFTLPVLEATSR
jgi:plastocyanin